MIAYILVSILVEAVLLSVVIRLIGRHEADTSFSNAVLVACAIVIVNLAVTLSLQQRLPPAWAGVAWLPTGVVGVMLITRLCWLPIAKAIFVMGLLLFVHALAGWALGPSAPPPPLALSAPAVPPAPAEATPAPNPSPTPPTPAPTPTEPTTYVPWLRAISGWQEARLAWADVGRAFTHALSRHRGAIELDWFRITQSLEYGDRDMVKSMLFMWNGLSRGEAGPPALEALQEALQRTTPFSNLFSRVSFRQLKPGSTQQGQLFEMEAVCAPRPLYGPLAEAVTTAERAARIALQTFAERSVLRAANGKHLERVKGLIDEARFLAGVQINSIRERGLQPMPGIPPEGAIFNIFSVRIEATGDLDAAINFIDACEQSSPQPTICGLLVGRKTLGSDRFAITVDLSWPTWADAELAGPVAEFAGADLTPPPLD